MENTTPDTTPVTTSEPSPAAPATSAPAPTSTTSERPKSFVEAFEQVAAKQETDAAVPGTAAATAQPASTTPQGATHPSAAKQGPIPFDVHKTALNNSYAERDAAKRDFATYREQHGWAEKIPRAQLEQIAAQTQRISSDPVGHIRDLVAEVGNHPTFGPQLRSEFARILGSARGQTKVDLEPDLVVRDEQGQVVAKSFSAEKVLALVQQVTDERVAPLKQESEQRKAAADQHAAQQKAAEIQKQVTAKVDDVIDEMHGILDITDPKAEASVRLYAAVNAVMEKNPTWSAHRAALEVRRTEIVPGLDAKATQAALDKQKQKAAGNTAQGAGAAGTPTRPRTVKDLARWMEVNARG